MNMTITVDTVSRNQVDEEKLGDVLIDVWDADVKQIGATTRRIGVVNTTTLTVIACT